MHSFLKSTKRKNINQTEPKKQLTPPLHEKNVPQKFKHLHYYRSQFPLLIFQRHKKSANCSLKCERGSNRLLQWERIWLHPTADRYAFCFLDTANVTDLLTVNTGPEKKNLKAHNSTGFNRTSRCRCGCSLPKLNSQPSALLSVLQNTCLDLKAQRWSKKGGNGMHIRETSICLHLCF